MCDEFKAYFQVPGENDPEEVGNSHGDHLERGVQTPVGSFGKRAPAGLPGTDMFYPAVSIV